MALCMDLEPRFHPRSSRHTARSYRIGFLAEVFLLPLDEAMKKTGIPYIRYVDDIRVLAKTEPDARRAAMTLELECRRLSLIPQSSKFSVARASNLTEALGALPSIVESTGPDAYEQTMDEETATTILRDAIGADPRVWSTRVAFDMFCTGAGRLRKC